MAFPDTGLPVIVEIAPGADPAGDPGTWTWVDITSSVRLRDGIDITQGRGDESSRVQPSRCVLRLDNRTGDFTPRNPLGQWYGQLARNTPIRVRVDLGSGPVDRFTGFVSSWPPRWDQSGRDATVPVEANGLLHRLGQGNPPVMSPLRRTIRATSPLAYWPAEDGTVSTQVGSDLPGVPAMSINGDVQFVPVDQFNLDTVLPASTQWGTPSVLDLADGGSLSGALPAAVTAGTASTWTVHVFTRVFIQSAAQTPLVLIEWDTPGGTYVRWQLRWTTSPIHDLQVVAIDGNGASTVAASMGFAPSAARVRDVSAWQDGGTIRIGLQWNGTTHEATGSLSGTLAGITGVRLNPAGATMVNDQLPVGHIAIWDKRPIPYQGQNLRADPYGVMVWGPPRSPYTNEAAHLRMARLCAEEGARITVPAVSADMVTRMGAQPIGTLLDLLDECERSDQGLLYEDGFALGYLPRQHRYNRQVSLALDRTQGHLANPPEPVDDDQRLRNRVTVKRSRGSSATVEDLTSIAQHGLYDEEFTVNLADDAKLGDHALWRLHLGTVDEMRWPRIDIDLAAAPELIDQWLACGVGSRVTVTNPPQQALGGTIDLIVEGYSEVLGFKDWHLSLNCSPASPWTVGVWDDPVLGRWDTAGSELAAPVSAAATSLSVATTSGPLWTTDPAAFPFDIECGGEQMTVTAISGTSSPQTFTVVRAVNGISKAHAAGTQVRLAQPMIWAL